MEKENSKKTKFARASACRSNDLLDRRKIPGVEILKYRKENNLTQEEFAKELGTTRAILVKMENGQREFKAEDIYKLSKFFDISADYLLGLSDNPSMKLEERKVTNKYGLSKKSLEKLESLEPFSLDLINKMITDEQIYDEVANDFFMYCMNLKRIKELKEETMTKFLNQETIKKLDFENNVLLYSIQENFINFIRTVAKKGNRRY